MPREFVVGALQTNIYTEACKKQDKTEIEWKHHWTFLINEYAALEQKMKELTKNSKIKVPEKMRKHVDPRTIFPVPEEVNHEYGWLASKKEFQLEIYGPDVKKYPPYKEEPF